MRPYLPAERSPARDIYFLESPLGPQHLNFSQLGGVSFPKLGVAPLDFIEELAYSSIPVNKGFWIIFSISKRKDAVAVLNRGEIVAIVVGASVVVGVWISITADEDVLGTPKGAEGPRILKAAEHPFYTGEFHIKGEWATLIGSMQDAPPGIISTMRGNI